MKYTYIILSVLVSQLTLCMEKNQADLEHTLSCMTIISAQNKQLSRMPNIEQEAPDIVCLQHTGYDDGELAYFKRKLDDDGYHSVEQTAKHKQVPLINTISFKSPVIKFYSFQMSNSPHSVSISVEKNNHCFRVISTLPDQDNSLVSHTQDSNKDELVIYASTIEEMINEQEQNANSFATKVPSKIVVYSLN